MKLLKSAVPYAIGSAMVEVPLYVFHQISLGDAVQSFLYVTLLLTLTQFVFQEWVLSAARDWRDEKDRARFIAENDSEPPPAPWEDRYTVKPWYVILSDKWEAHDRVR